MLAFCFESVSIHFTKMLALGISSLNKKRVHFNTYLALSIFIFVFLNLLFFIQDCNDRQKIDNILLTSSLFLVAL